MKCYEVTGVVAAEKRLSALDELSLIALRSPEGNGWWQPTCWGCVLATGWW